MLRLCKASSIPRSRKLPLTTIVRSIDSTCRICRPRHASMRRTPCYEISEEPTLICRQLSSKIKNTSFLARTGSRRSWKRLQASRRISALRTWPSSLLHPKRIAEDTRTINRIGTNGSSARPSFGFNSRCYFVLP
jgi:hypothetical protein